MQDPYLRALTKSYMLEMVNAVPYVPGVDLFQYIDTLLERWTLDLLQYLYNIANNIFWEQMIFLSLLGAIGWTITFVILYCQQVREIFLILHTCMYISLVLSIFIYCISFHQIYFGTWICCRFENVAISDQLSRLCLDGSSKFSFFVEDGLVELLYEGTKTTAIGWFSEKYSILQFLQFLTRVRHTVCMYKLAHIPYICITPSDCSPVSGRLDRVPESDPSWCHPGPPERIVETTRPGVSHPPQQLHIPATDSAKTARFPRIRRSDGHVPSQAQSRGGQANTQGSHGGSDEAMSEYDVQWGVLL